MVQGLERVGMMVDTKDVDIMLLHDPTDQYLTKV